MVVIVEAMKFARLLSEDHPALSAQYSLLAHRLQRLAALQLADAATPGAAPSGGQPDEPTVEVPLDRRQDGSRSRGSGEVQQRKPSMRDALKRVVTFTEQQVWMGRTTRAHPCEGSDLPY